MKKLDDRQVEKLLHAMDYVHSVMIDLEEKKNTKRICNRLDNIVGELYDIIDRGKR